MKLQKFLRGNIPLVPFTKKQIYELEILFRPLLDFEVDDISCLVLKRVVFKENNLNKRNIYLGNLLFRKLRKEGLISRHSYPMQNVPRPKADLAATELSEEYVSRLIAYLHRATKPEGGKVPHSKQSALLALVLTAGFGQDIKDIVALKVKDIDIEDCEIVFGEKRISFDFIAYPLRDLTITLLEEAAKNPDKNAFVLMNHNVNRRNVGIIICSVIKKSCCELLFPPPMALKSFRYFYIKNMAHLSMEQLIYIMGDKNYYNVIKNNHSFLEAKSEVEQRHRRAKLLEIEDPIKQIGYHVTKRAAEQVVSQENIQ